MAERQDPKTFVNNLVIDTKALLTDNIALAKAEVTPSAKAAGVGGGMFGAAGYLAANAASLLFLAGGFGFAKLFASLLDWSAIPAIALGFVTMAVVLLLLAGILALIGKSKMKQVKPPEKAIKEAKATVATVKQSLTTGIDEVNANTRDRKGLAVAKRAAKDLDETTAYQASSSKGATAL
ncbi:MULTISPECIES: phage holin family protein [unclassified Luteococcus]|uniref:phage holin family protein n=1 Tax=unclassified Luteococcus TaxID=2639923 RepID=UPI00313A8893